MSLRGSLSTVITTILGATLGGLLIWRVYHRQRKRLPSIHKAVGPVEASSLVEKNLECSESPATPCSSPAAAIQSPEKLLGVEPLVVSSEQEWDQVWPSLQKDLLVCPVLGFDCEWVKDIGVSVKGRTTSVSLLQMASYSGMCVLVRLVPFRHEKSSLPLGLVEVLRDPHVLKVGVGCYEDGKRLTHDYGLPLGSTVDIRYLALRQRQELLNNGLSLKSLAADLLNIALDKSLRVRCSDWEADQLTAEQMGYAAKDAQVSIALFFRLLGGDAGPPATPSGGGMGAYAQLAARCQGLVDVPFRERSAARALVDPDDDNDGEGAAEGRAKRLSRKLTYESPDCGDQRVPDHRRNHRRKPLGVGYSARKSPLYDNCFLHAPDGQPLCTCDKKKARWYLNKGIGVLESEEPFTVRLLFEPSGRPDSIHDYYLTAKENLCVVCGKADSYIRKNIVPHEYRRHFPTEMKDHNSHDILLLCTACHAASNVHDGFLKQRLAGEYSAPQGCEEGVRLHEDPDRRRVRSAARALLTASEALPDRRRHELQDLVRDFLDVGGQQELTVEEIQHAADLETRIFNESYVPHGLKVVRAQAEHGLHGLMELERRWRQHFLSSMQPRHLPPLWSVDHNHRKLLLKYGEDLLIKLN